VAPPPRTAASGRSTRANSSAPVPCARQSAGPAPLLPSTRPMGPATWSEGTAPVARPCDRGRRRVRLGLHRPPQTALAVRQQEQRHSLTAGQEALRAARGRAGVGPRVGPTGRPRQREHPDLQKQPSGRQDLNLRPFDPQDMGVGPAPGPGFNEARAEERDPCSSCHRRRKSRRWPTCCLCRTELLTGRPCREPPVDQAFLGFRSRRAVTNSCTPRAVAA